jgi:type II secretory pathway component PulM
MAGNIFTRHPREVGESYAAHFVNASQFGLRMLAGGGAVLVHAIFPFLFVQTGSRTMDKLHRRMTGRGERVDWERYPII